jgi:hypothetical protein
MADLATSDDLEVRLGRSLTNVESERAEGILADVSAAIRAYTGQTFEVVETTEVVKIRSSGVAILSQRPVLEVSTVADHNENDVTFSWLEGDDRIHLSPQVPDTFSFVPYRTPLRKVRVTYEHGYETVPPVVVGVACSIALRALGQTPTDGGTVEEQIDDYRYRLGSAAGAGGFGLLPDERAALDPFRRTLGGFRVAS